MNPAKVLTDPERRASPSPRVHRLPARTLPPSPRIYYYNNPSDYDWLKKVVENMLTSFYCVGIVAIENASWGAIKAIYR